MKTVSDRIFELLKERKMTQKEFAQRTGIAESSISDWKKKRTNPVSDKILIICEVLGVSPYELLSGAEHTGSRSREHDTYVISKGTDVGTLVESYQELDSDLQKRLLGYLEALKDRNLPIINSVRSVIADKYSIRALRQSPLDEPFNNPLVKRFFTVNKL